MLQRLEGIVLNTLKYKDTSLIAHVYTDVWGRASFVVPVSRSRKAAVRSVIFQPLAVVEIETDYRPRDTLFRVKEAKVSSPFTSLPYDPVKSALALFAAEFLYRVVREEEANAPLFAYLRSAVQWLDACGQGVANFHLVFLMRLLRFLGVYPNLEGYKPGCYFDLRNACFTSSPSVFADECLPPSEAARLFTLMRMDFGTMHLFKMSRQERGRCLEVIEHYYRLHLPEFGELRSPAVLHELFG